MSTPNTGTPMVASPAAAVETPDQAPEIQSEGAAPEAAAETKPLTKTEEKKFLKSLKLKVDGKEIDEALPFDLPDDPKAIEYMQRQLQMSRMGQNRAQEKAELEKRVAGFIDALRKNPRAVLSDPNIGIDMKQLAAQVIEEEIQNSQKSPEQLEREKLEGELKRLQDERKKEQEDFQRREFERLQQVEFERYNTAMDTVLKDSDLPKSDYVKKKMADYMLLGLQQGHDLDPKDVLPLVRKEIMEDLKSMFEVMPEDVVEKLVGKDKLTSLRKKNVAKAKAAPSAVAAIKDVVGKKQEAPAKKQTLKQLFGV